MTSPAGLAAAKKRALAKKPKPPKAPRKKRPADKADKDRARRREIRLIAIGVMGGKCSVCGNADERVLEFDHIVPLLRRTRRLRNVNDNFRAIKRLLSGESDHGLQLLCANCHRIKTREGQEWALRFGLTIGDEQQPEQADLFAA